MTIVLEPPADAPARPHLELFGSLDSEGATRLSAQLNDVFAPGIDLTIDLSQVDHLSAEALSVLVHAYRRLRDGGGSLLLSKASPPVLRVLRISGLHKVLLSAPAVSPA